MIANKNNNRFHTGFQQNNQFAENTDINPYPSN